MNTSYRTWTDSRGVTYSTYVVDGETVVESAGYTNMTSDQRMAQIDTAFAEAIELWKATQS
jgi:hypothetical protein